MKIKNAYSSIIIVNINRAILWSNTLILSSCIGGIVKYFFHPTSSRTQCHHTLSGFLHITHALRRWFCLQMVVCYRIMVMY